jgi:hypothetical protein
MFQGEKTMTSNELSSTVPLTLETVKIQFDHWRLTRARGAKTPKHLWEAIQELTKIYAHEQIASTLNVNLHWLRTKLEKQSHQPSALLKTDFVEIPLSPLTSSYPPSPEPKTLKSDVCAPIILEFTRPDGLALKASGLNHNDLFSLVKSFFSH